MNNLIPSYQSHKIKVCNFILIILIVWLHSNLTKFGASGLNYDLQYLVAHGFASVGVVMFFLISGFLFFYTDKPYNKAFFKYKLKRRFYSLFIPYILWNGIGIGLATLTYYLQGAFHMEGQIDPPVSSFPNFLLSIFYYNKATYQLWFLRDLIILAIVSPFIFYTIHILRRYFIILLFLYSIFPFNLVFLGSDSIFFYTLGAFIAIVYPNFLFLRLRASIISILLLIYLIGIFLHCLSPYSFFQLNATFGLYLRILSCVIVWFGYDYILYLHHFNKKALLGATFFIYVAHEPMLTAIKKTMLAFVGNSQLSLFIVFIVSPIIAIWLCIIIKNILSLHLPSVSRILNGNR